jgi:hypothetical protein
MLNIEVLLRLKNRDKFQIYDDERREERSERREARSERIQNNDIHILNYTSQKISNIE